MYSWLKFYLNMYFFSLYYEKNSFGLVGVVIKRRGGWFIFGILYGYV